MMLRLLLAAAVALAHVVVASHPAGGYVRLRRPEHQS